MTGTARDLGSGQFGVNSVDTSSQVYAGTVSATSSAGTALNSGTGALITELILQSDPANTGKILFGSSSSQPFVLEAGDSIVIPVTNPALIYVKASTGTQVANWFARGG